MPHSTLHLHDVTVCYGQRPAVHHVGFDLPCGALAALIGPNGSGKSSLLKAVLGWLPLSSGSIGIDGRPVSESANRIAYLPQRENVDLDFPITVADVVAQGRYRALGWARGFDADDHRRVEQALVELGLDRLRDRPLAQLSGGQQQRTFLARALATGADIFLLDEPLSALDTPARHDLLARLRRWATEAHRLVIVVTHHLDEIAPYFTHAVLINTHLIAAGPVAEVLVPSHLRTCFGATPGLLRPVPDLGPILRHGHSPVER